MIYLASGDDDFQSRISVARVFWPHASVHHARGALKQAVFAIRRALCVDVIRSRAAFEIGIDRGMVACDAHEFRKAVASGRSDAASLYKGEFLKGFDADIGREFSEWVAAERRALAALRIPVEDAGD